MRRRRRQPLKNMMETNEKHTEKGAESTFVVLLSTYNGERFLRTQIDSILAQEGVGVQIVARDDGSQDATQDILNDYQQRGLLTWEQGKENLGPARSFMELLKNAPRGDYYAFADQDDFWMKDKLCSALQHTKSAMATEEKPFLYFCQTQLTDQQLQPMPSVIIHPKLTFGEALVYQFIGGCTMVMNNALRDIVCRYHPTFLPMHDVWIYDIAQAVGARICFDPTPHILYRQHGDNTIGQGQGRLHAWRERLDRVVLNREHRRSRMANELKQGFADLMPSENRDLLESFIRGKSSLRARLKLLKDPRFEPADETTKKLFKINVILNSY